VPDVTVTPTTQSVTVASSVTINDPVFVDQHRATQFSLFTDGATAGDFNANAINGGTITYYSTCDADSVCYVEMKTDTVSSGSRAWLSERDNNGEQPAILAGVFEMECSARVKIDKNSTTQCSFRVGFFNGHVPAGDPPSDVNGINFQVFGGETTWHVLLCVNANNDDPSEQFILVDTEVSCDEWHVLRVWANAAGTAVRFYIDGNMVYENTDGSKIPTGSNFLLPRSSGYWMHSGAVVRSGNDGAGTQPTMYVDWLQTIIRSDRS
jgi:hypothetical protein